MDGHFTANRLEQIRQAGISRERCLAVSTIAPDLNDASGWAGLDPASAPEGQNGPHFIMSPETPDGRPTLGFEFFLAYGPGGALPLMDPGAAGCTVTIWKLPVNAQTGPFQGALGVPIYASFAPQTGVYLFEYYHSFDVNPCALRFQVVPDLAGGGVDGSFQIWFNEL